MKQLLNWRELPNLSRATTLSAAAATVSFLAYAMVSNSAPSPVVSIKQNVDSHQAHRSVGKRAAPFEFVTPARYIAQQGEIVTVTVDVRMVANVRSFDAAVVGEKGVAVVRAPELKQQQRANLAHGDVVSLKFDVMAANEGLTYVNVIGQADAGNGMRMSSYSVALEVGDLKRAATDKRTAKAGQRVIDDQGVVLRVYHSAEAEEAVRHGEQLR